MNPLQLPTAHGKPPVSGAIRVAPEDFVVREWLGFEADGEGDHWLLTVRKRGANTHWVAKQLAKQAGIHPRDVGFAGLKDRNAVTEQAFTLPVRTAVSDWSGASGDGFEVVSAQRHRRKLKRGALRGNDFDLIVRNPAGDVHLLGERIAAIAAKGVPNYFGPQRFGHGGSNLLRARQWLGGEIDVADRFERGFALSAARAQLFNNVLARRVNDGTWNKLLAGDVANLNGTQSIFRVDQVDAVLTERCERMDVHPSGPLWGRGEPSSQGQVADLERQVADEEATLAAGLAKAGLEQERRPLRIAVLNLDWRLEADRLHLKFRLPRGAFATTVLHELIEGVFAQAVDEGEGD
jgi:tRNA pseudouridine13 synthase